MAIKFLNIFYCDDDGEDIEIFTALVKRISDNAKVTVTRDPVEGIKLLKETKPKPHILFFDSSMPKMDGFECVIAVKRNKELKKIPIVIVSGGLQKKHIEQYNKLGVFMFLAKADLYSMEQLLRSVFNIHSEG